MLKIVHGKRYWARDLATNRRSNERVSEKRHRLFVTTVNLHYLLIVIAVTCLSCERPEPIPKHYARIVGKWSIVQGEQAGAPGHAWHNGDVLMLASDGFGYLEESPVLGSGRRRVKRQIVYQFDGTNLAIYSSFANPSITDAFSAATVFQVVALDESNMRLVCTRRIMKALKFGEERVLPEYDATELVLTLRR